MDAGYPLLSEQVAPAVLKERVRRIRLAREGRPYHHWHYRNVEEGPPPVEHWCEFCVGFFGVPHDRQHPCREVGRARAGDKVCACIECAVVYAERLGDAI